MTIQEIYNLAINLGIKSDPRGSKRIGQIIDNNKKEFNKLDKSAKKSFDQEKLTNPYSDTRIVAGNPKKSVKRILAGIDVSVSESLLADRLAEKGKKVDLILAHHPLGRALASLDEVIDLQADLMAQYGVPINIAESILEPRISEINRQLSPINHFRPVDAANILNQNLMCCHTVCDNLVYNYIKKIIEKKNPETVEELVDLIKTIPEYAQADLMGIGPKIFSGNAKRRCGKIALTEITGGTSGSKQAYEKLSQAGVGTIVGMHIDEEYKKEAEKNHINIVIAGHMASDSLGMNLLLDKLEAKGIQIIPCSGLIRIKRNK